MRNGVYKQLTSTVPLDTYPLPLLRNRIRLRIGGIPDPTRPFHLSAVSPPTSPLYALNERRPDEGYDPVDGDAASRRKPYGYDVVTLALMVLSVHSAQFGPVVLCRCNCRSCSYFTFWGCGCARVIAALARPYSNIELKKCEKE